MDFEGIPIGNTILASNVIAVQKNSQSHLDHPCHGMALPIQTIVSRSSPQETPKHASLIS
ncbi:hypothetical protein COCSUDRAFT_32372 [Coccomyxa subellipsoidea C-169]|uniref:Uncharacterized protein n=1 Tax=Coccomyxa subellipsoidea (strain C-169) TaxID=574566 RepID=I0Z553_COCSC|nr:hypothetical protein COCSUDRAFT_32372 [Coccomyxa subellipsoidea C-169]EIE25772.1 hypothetical protein COCSUDRAFT_32372 [Coccomyxa subellipsoidea C-169]|eukprot:XP_005650316.1 hypothetical protein COCSUDRAFT_32372 [Coccomyxa subellipsoidea C-169]